MLSGIAENTNMTLNHLSLCVPDVRKAQDFFESYFSFKKSSDHEEGVFLKNERGFLLALDPLEKNEENKLPQAFHLGFCLDNPFLVRDLFVKMKSEGVEFARELREFGEEAVNFYCWAPGGYKLEVSWYREEC